MRRKLPPGWVAGEPREVRPKFRGMIVGEAPGKEEWEEKRPFVGRAGCCLLRPALKSVGIDPDVVYITNTVKIWPRNDADKTRSPNADEIEEAFPYLCAEINDIAPAFVLALGNAAHRTLTDSGEGITAARGQWRPLAKGFSYKGAVEVLSTFHPSYILRGSAVDDCHRWLDDLAAFAARIVGT